MIAVGLKILMTGDVPNGTFQAFCEPQFLFRRHSATPRRSTFLCRTGEHLVRGNSVLGAA
jgi:hypothetical protein